MRKFLYYLCLLTVPASVGAVAAIPDVDYVQWFLKQQCRNPEITLPAVENYRAIAGHKYTLGLIDILNENTTTYATDLSRDNLISTSYLDEMRNLLKKSSTCWLLNLAACPVYENLLDEKYASNISHLTPVEHAGQCPPDTEFYDIDLTSMCAGLTNDNSESSYMTVPNTVGNRGYWAIGENCVAGAADCENVYIRGQVHCSAMGAVNSETADIFENHGPSCWCRLTDVASPDGKLLPYDGSWMYINSAGCNNRCGELCAMVFRRDNGQRHLTFVSSSTSGGVCGPVVSNTEISYNIISDRDGGWAVGTVCAGETENTDMATMCGDVIVAGTAHCLDVMRGMHTSGWWGVNDMNEDIAPTSASHGCHCRRKIVRIDGELVQSESQGVFLGEFGSVSICRQNCARACAENVSMDVGGMRNAIMTLPRPPVTTE